MLARCLPARQIRDPDWASPADERHLVVVGGGLAMLTLSTYGSSYVVYVLPAAVLALDAPAWPLAALRAQSPRTSAPSGPAGRPPRMDSPARHRRIGACQGAGCLSQVDARRNDLIVDGARTLGAARPLYRAAVVLRHRCCPRPRSCQRAGTAPSGLGSPESRPRSWHAGGQAVQVTAIGQGHDRPQAGQRHGTGVDCGGWGLSLRCLHLAGGLRRV
jgi:hypothetical protein